MNFLYINMRKRKNFTCKRDFTLISSPLHFYQKEQEKSPKISLLSKKPNKKKKDLKIKLVKSKYDYLRRKTKTAGNVPRKSTYMESNEPRKRGYRKIRKLNNLIFKKCKEWFTEVFLQRI